MNIGELHILASKLGETSAATMVKIVGRRLSILAEEGSKLEELNRETEIFRLDPPSSTAIEQILTRALLKARVEKMSLLLLLVYIDRLSKIGKFFLTKNSLHLLTAAALMCADKLISDGYVGNREFSQAIGLNVAKVNALEVRFLKLIDWNILVHMSELKQTCGDLFEDHTEKSMSSITIIS